MLKSLYVKTECKILVFFNWKKLQYMFQSFYLFIYLFITLSMFFHIYSIPGASL
jgi:hypothetical protein